ncbi:MAG: chemotaxis response regulator protein-glutamate methylesterase [Nitrospirae bacterium]|nr:chemotaxis response regulator protein-glutamate methylesterase [Nitrospirota bacterium]
MRKMITKMLASDIDIDVAGTAMDGLFALNKIADMRPDVITLDINMPRMGGIATLRHIVTDYGIPTVIVSSVTKKDEELTLEALDIGAFDFVTKPQNGISSNIGDISEELIAKIKAACLNPFTRPPSGPRDRPAARGLTRPVQLQHPAERVLAIGASTGGPNALNYLLPRISSGFPAGILIVQHMPAGFTETFAARLNAICGIEVKEASEGDLVLPGRALIAPGGRHMKVKRLPLGSVVLLSDAEAVNGHRPSVDALFHSVAVEFGEKATGLILTGMGNDGAEGLAEIKAAGGMTVAQDEKSCVVFGMPKAAIERGAARDVMTLERMDGFLSDHYFR